MFGYQSVPRPPGVRRQRFVPDDRGAQFLFRLAAEQRLQVRHLRASVPTLEDVFARAVGEAQER